ncbi:MAG: N-acetylmuramidase family protein [Mucinivorans sp.]
MKTIKFGQYVEQDLVVTLQKLLAKYGFSITSDGVLGEATRQAVIEFQRQHQLSADGIVGYRTWEALFFDNRDNNQVSLRQEDIELAAQLLDCEPASLMAVQQVETAGRGGFFKPEMPAILFEGHIFWNQLTNRGLKAELYVKGNENILYQKWSHTHYKGGIAEYDRLAKARAIHREAADASTSWGMFQIMGFNYAACGEKSVVAFVAMMHKSELHQLLLFARFVNKNKKILYALQQKDWAKFAEHYNGPAYSQNSYDVKLAQAYRAAKN